MRDTNLTSAIKAELANAFGARLKGVVLYGSQARGDADADADLDLLVLLDPPIALGEDLDTIVEALYPLQLECGQPIHALPVAAETYQAAQFGLYRNAMREGVLL